jgi:hypothetical protein
MRFLYIIASIILLLSACTSVASGTLVYVVAKHSEISHKKNKQYNGSHRCVIKGRPSPYHIAEQIVHGSAITHKYHNVLNNYEEAATDNPLPPHHVAYAFYTIAKRIGDNRATNRMEWLRPYFLETKPKKIEEKVQMRYLNSYLRKCFFVPPALRSYQDPRHNYIKPDKPTT